MTGRELTGLAIKVFAIYVLVNAVYAVAGLVTTFLANRDGLYEGLPFFWFWVLGAIAVVLLFTFGVVLWRVSKRTIEPPKPSAGESGIATISETFALSLLGLYLVFDGLRRTAFLAVGAYSEFAGTASSLDHGAAAQTLVYIGCYIVQIIVGLTLIFGANWWVSLLRRLREAGLGDRSAVRGD